MPTPINWQPIRDELEASLKRLEGVAKNKVRPYLDSLEPKILQIATLPPDQVDEAIEAVQVNAQLDLAILGVQAETELARISLALLRMATGLLRTLAV